MKKPYLLIAGAEYYPSAGVGDWMSKIAMSAYRYFAMKYKEMIK